MASRPRGAGGYINQRPPRGSWDSFAVRNQAFPNGPRFPTPFPAQQERFQRPHNGNRQPEPRRRWVDNPRDLRPPQNYGQFGPSAWQQDDGSPEWQGTGFETHEWQGMGFESQGMGFGWQGIGFGRQGMGFTGNPALQQSGNGNRWQQNGLENRAWQQNGTGYSAWQNGGPPQSISEREEGPKLSLSAPTNLQRYVLFEIMLTCGVEIYGKKYLAIYWFHFESEEENTSLHSPLFENDSRLHAEEALLKYLRAHLSHTKRDNLISITIMQNASPCSRCSEGYRKDLKPLVDSGISISVVFSSFHWVRRRSCRHNGHRHREVHIFDHEANIAGLKTLRAVGLEVRTTQYEDWRRLCDALQVPPPDYLQSQEQYDSSASGQEDSSLRDDLEHIFDA